MDEWFESEVTEYFLSLVQSICNEIQEEMADQGFDTQSAEQLMAHRANLWGLRTAFAQVEAVFVDRSFSDMEEDDGESVGDTSLGGSGPH